MDRGPIARKRDVGFIYHTAKLRDLQKQAAELEVEFPFTIPGQSLTYIVLSVQ